MEGVLWSTFPYNSSVHPYLLGTRGPVALVLVASDIEDMVIHIGHPLISHGCNSATWVVMACPYLPVWAARPSLLTFYVKVTAPYNHPLTLPGEGKPGRVPCVVLERLPCEGC